MKTSEAEKFIGQLRLAGKMDSSGSFTVRPEHGFQGLKVFEDSAECLLKLVQTAVRAKAKSIELRIAVASVEIVFDPEAHYSAPELLEQLADPSKDWATLVLALRGALQVGFKEIRFTSWWAGEGKSLRLNHERIEESEPFSWPWSGESGLRLKLIRDTGLFSLKSLKARFAESKVLTDRCRFCPVPLKSSGFIVNNPDLVAGFDNSGSVTVEAVVRPMEGSSSLVCGPTPEYRWTHSLTFEDQTKVGETEFSSPGLSGRPYLFITLQATREKKILDILRIRPADPGMRREALQACEAVLGYCKFGPDETWVIPVIDGVCCQTLKMEGLTSSTIVYIAATDLRTDFAGFRVIDDENVDHLLEKVGQYVDAMFQSLDSTRFAEPGRVRRQTQLGDGPCRKLAGLSIQIGPEAVEPLDDDAWGEWTVS